MPIFFGVCQQAPSSWQYIILTGDIEVAYGNAWSKAGHAVHPLTPNWLLPEQRTCGRDPIRNIGDSRIPIAKRFSKPKSYIFKFSLLIKSRLAWLLQDQRVCGFSRRIFHLADS
jgi:hypothetical protein